MSVIDSLFRNLILTNHFVKGWGQPKHIKRLLDLRKVLSIRDTAYSLVDKDHKINITSDKKEGDLHIIAGDFHSPWDKIIPGVMPSAVKKASFQMILPQKWSGPQKPICIQLAGTGDHGYFLRRKLMAEPLLRESGIASILVENPFYGTRKPQDQFDLIVMGGALMFESIVLLHYCEKQGWGPFCLTGISMGGYMSSLAATIWPKPISLVPCLSGTTASPVYTRGVLSKAIRWDVLKSSYYEDKEYEHEIRPQFESPEKGTSRFSSKSNVPEEYHRDVQDALMRIKEASIGKQTDKIGKSIRQLRHVDDWKAKSFSRVASNIQNSVTLTSQNTNSLDAETLNFMWEMMDEFTHLGNYSIPVDPKLILSVVAQEDAYIPRDKVISSQDLWPGSEVRVIPGGHITSVTVSHRYFRKAITDCIDKYNMLYSKKENRAHL